MSTVITIYLEESGDDEERRRRNRRRAIGFAAGALIVLAALYEKAPPAIPAPRIVQVVEVEKFVPVLQPLAVAQWPELPVVTRREIRARRRASPMPPIPIATLATSATELPTLLRTPSPSAAPQLMPRITPRVLNFRATGWQPIELANPFDQPIRIDRISVETIRGPNPPAFEILNEERCVGVLQPRARCRITVFARPAAVRESHAIRIAVFHDGHAEPATLDAVGR